jgi:hypothetical protein
MCWASFALVRVFRPSLFASNVAIDSTRTAATLLNATPTASKPSCDAGSHVTLGCERPSGSI